MARTKGAKNQTTKTKLRMIPEQIKKLEAEKAEQQAIIDTAAKVILEQKAVQKEATRIIGSINRKIKYLKKRIEEAKTQEESRKHLEEVQKRVEELYHSGMSYEDIMRKLS